MLLVPAILWAVPVYGAIGAAWIWVTLNAGYCLIGVHFMYRRILRTEKWAWYRIDVVVPFAGAASIAWLCRWAMPDDLGRVGELGVLIASSVCALSVAAVAAPLIRAQLSRMIIK